MSGGSAVRSMGNNTASKIASNDSNNVDVLIIGAGAAGMSSGYLLNQQGIDFQIIEACDCIGGRMRVDEVFTDFPVCFGAEWFSEEGSDEDELELIVNDPSVNVDVELFNDAPDRKFYRSSWFNFFEEYILPSISDKITFYQTVSEINYTGSVVSVTTTTGTVFTANKVIVTVPLAILKNGDITFIPSLPAGKQNSINNLQYWEGFRAYFKFSNKFYPNFEYVGPGGMNQQKAFYDAAFGHDSADNVFGLFCVGEPVLEYNQLVGNELRDFILAELDDRYNNQATPAYIDHVFYKWDENPYARGAYIADTENGNNFNNLEDDLDGKVFFAGDSYTNGDNWGYVHVAAQRARAVVDEITA